MGGMMRPKRVLLFDTAIATSNIGDEIIFSSVKDALKPVIEEAAIYRMGTHVENYSSFQMLLHRTLLPDPKIRALSEGSDLKFICGTNFCRCFIFSPQNKPPMNQLLAVFVSKVFPTTKYSTSSVVLQLLCTRL